MDKARIVRHGIKHALALTAVATGVLIVMQAVRPDVTAKLMGKSSDEQAGGSFEGFSIAYLFGGSKRHEITPGSKHQRITSDFLSRPSRHALPTAPVDDAPAISSGFARLAQYGIGAGPSASSSPFLTFNSDGPASPVAAQPDQQPAPPTSAPQPAGRTAATRSTPSQASSRPLSAQAAPSNAAMPAPALQQPTPQNVALPDQTPPPQLTPPEQRSPVQAATPPQYVPPQAAPQRQFSQQTLAKDAEVVESLVLRARDDIKLVPYAVAAVREFSQSYANQPKNRDLLNQVQELRQLHHREMRERSQLDTGAALAKAGFSEETRAWMATCFAKIVPVKGVYVARRVISAGSPAPAYMVAVETAKLADEKMKANARADINACLRPLFTTGTVSVFFDLPGKAGADAAKETTQAAADLHTASIQRIRKHPEARVFSRGLLQTAGSGKK